MLLARRVAMAGGDGLEAFQVARRGAVVPEAADVLAAAPAPEALLRPFRVVRHAGRVLQVDAPFAPDLIAVESGQWGGLVFVIV